jgi:hypothetical protein
MNILHTFSTPNNKTLRQFSAAWVVFFSVMALKHGFKLRNLDATEIAFIAAACLGAAGIVRPRLTRHIYRYAMVLTSPIGWLVSEIAFALLFFIVLTPIAFWFRMRGRDGLRRNSRSRDTYWQPLGTVRDAADYLKQY